MKLELFESEYKDIKEYTGTDYEGDKKDNKVYVDAEAIDEMLYELISHIKHIKEEKEDIKKDMEDNWTRKGGMLED